MATDDTLTIAEAARRTGLTPHTLRYYEQQGLMLDWVERTDATHRRYSAGAIAWIEFLTKLRATGMPIRRMRRYAQLVGAGEGNEVERLALLDEHRATVRARLDLLEGNLAEIEEDVGLPRRARERVHAGQLRRERPEPCRLRAIVLAVDRVGDGAPAAVGAAPRLETGRGRGPHLRPRRRARRGELGEQRPPVLVDPAGVDHLRRREVRCSGVRM